MVGFNLGQQGAFAVRPIDQDRIYCFDFPQAKIRAWIHRRLKAPHGHLLQVLQLVGVFQGNFSPQCIGVFSFATQFKLEVMVILVYYFRIVAVNEGGHVDIVGHQIQVAIIVQIAIGRAIGMAGFT